MYLKDKKINLGIVFTIFVSYILIKLIDNYKYFLDIFKLLVSLLNPFIIAFILAYIFIPIVVFLESKLKIKRIYALIITYVCLILIIASFIFFTIPIIVNSLADIIDKLPIYSAKTQDFLIHLGNNLENIDPNTLKEIGDKAFSFMPKVSNLFIGYLGQIFATTFSISKFIVQFVLAFIICFYIILEKEIFFSFYKKILYITFGKKHANFVLNFGHTLNNNIGKYFTGKMLDSFIVGILSSIGLYFIGSQYSLLFGILIVFMNMIPYFGPAISMTTIVLINLFYNPSIALFSLIYLILVQQIEIAFIEPKIVGGQLGLNPFLTILAVTIGGGFFGIPGMILSAPFMGVLKIYLGNYIDYKYESINK
ncbi:pheromone autoinducer 2 transporter [uncultured Clostridium sp.]|nr:pheromone autoinducer 2 transporter [uncultured Clostridium sp.]SCJ04490.1 pheromone autoinducer 2 transporter [uncultured Clostridium sp.]